MAEFVEFRIEETIPEVEEMERLGILSTKEVKKLIQKRKDFLYRLAKRAKRKMDYVSYIDYEKKLIELIKIRRKQTGVYEKRHQIEAPISRRVLKQARLLTSLWPAHRDTWALRIGLASFIGWRGEINFAYGEQVKFHGNCERVWVSWAKWEIEERQNFDHAREILLSKASRYHPKSCLVKRELFRLELLFVEMLKSKVKHGNIAGLEEVIAKNQDKVLNCAVARVVYREAVSALPQPEMYLQLYQVADKFEFAHKLREEIYRDLCMKFPDAECLWKLKAQRLISGLGETHLKLEEVTKATGSGVGEGNSEAEVAVKTEGGTAKPTGKNTINQVKGTNADTKENQEEGSRDEGDGKRSEEGSEEDGKMQEDCEMEEDSGEAEEKELSDVEEEEEEEEDEEESAIEDENEIEEEGDDNENKMKVDEEEEEEEGVVEEEEEEEEKEEEDSDNEEKEDSDTKDDKGHSEEIPKEESVDKKLDLDKLQIVETGNRETAAGNDGSHDLQREGVKEEVKAHSPNSINFLPIPSGTANPKAKLQLLISIFDRAVEVVGAKFAVTYIDELLPLLRQCWGMPDLTRLIYNTLIKLFEQHTALLSPLHFYIWYQVVCEHPAGQHTPEAVLQEAVRQHPGATHLQLELARCVIKEADTDAHVLKEFKKLSSSLQGECGLIAWREFAKHLCKDNNKEKVFSAAVDHEDLTVARGMRLLHLQEVALLEGINGARKLYQKLKWRPPFCGRLHALMVELELARGTVDAEAVREVFAVSVQQQAATNPGMWLAYIHFEKKHGDPLKAGGLLTRAERELEAQKARIFRELNLTIQDLSKKGGPGVTSEHGNNVFVEETEEEESRCEDVESPPALVHLLEEELTLSYAANNARTAFFAAVHAMDKNIKKGNKPAPHKDGREWEKVLGLLLGHKITLAIQEVKVQTPAHTDTDDKPAQHKLVRPRFRNKYNPTDKLDPGEEKTSVQTTNEDDIEKILATSEVLQPEFMQKTSLAPYFVNKKKAKEIRKKELAKTKGPGWFNMKAPELTEEVKRELEVLQMRSVLDPKRHYKNDMKVLPKNFHLGEVIDSPIDFYSSRVPKKKRKRTMAEEILHDEEALRYQKKKYNEIITAQQKKQFKHPNVLKKKKKNNLSTKKK